MLRTLGFITAMAASYAAIAWLWVSMQYSAALLGDLARPTYGTITVLLAFVAWRTWPKAAPPTWRDRAMRYTIPFTVVAVAVAAAATAAAAI